jgi:DNA-binding NarL/FixJ family response regulator
LDINMPQLNGYDTQEYITKHWPEMKTLAMSIYDDPESVEQMVKNGSNGFISKNLPIKLLHEAIMAVYHHGIYPMQNKTPIHLKGLPLLTEREKEFLTLTCAELNMEETAKKMNISMRTADRYRENVYQKLKVTNKAELIFYVNRTAIVFMK